MHWIIHTSLVFHKFIVHGQSFIMINLFKISVVNFKLIRIIVNRKVIFIFFVDLVFDCFKFEGEFIFIVDDVEDIVLLRVGKANIYFGFVDLCIRDCIRLLFFKIFITISKF